jgi:hypothetical protein
MERQERNKVRRRKRRRGKGRERVVVGGEEEEEEEEEGGEKGKCSEGIRRSPEVKVPFRGVHW